MRKIMLNVDGAMRKGPLAFMPAMSISVSAVAILITGCHSQTNTKADATAVAARESTEACRQDVSEKAAAIARKQYPEALPPNQWRLLRNAYISSHKWELFDINHDGFLDFDEYLSMEWAGYLVQVPAGKTVITKLEYMNRFLGDAGDKFSGWHVPYQPQVVAGLYSGVDPYNKGFITCEDIRLEAMRSFSFSDKHHKGRISKDEL